MYGPLGGKYMSQQDTESIMALRHFSHTKPITCSFISGNLESFFSVRIKGPLGVYINISKGDPITFGKLDNNEPNIYGGFILSKNEGDITISPDMTSFKVERRKNIRYPVSLMGSIKNISGRSSSSTAWIKDISYEGMRLCAECDLEVNDEVELNICEQTQVHTMEGTVVRKASLFGRNEYGILLSFRYKSSIFTSRDIIDHMILQEKKLFYNHLTGK